MDFSHLTNLPLALHIHLLAAISAVVLGPVALYRRQRDIWHKTAGYLWVVVMLTVAVGAFWLEAVILPIWGGFGVIHLLAGPVIWTLWHGVQAARAGHVARHRAYMRGLYWQGLMVAGLFTLLPYRVLNRVLFPGTPELGYGVILVVALGAGIVAMRRRGPAPEADRPG
jgi:uncharacterized membrane protein